MVGKKHMSAPTATSHGACSMPTAPVPARALRQGTIDDRKQTPGNGSTVADACKRANRTRACALTATRTAPTILAPAMIEDVAAETERITDPHPFRREDARFECRYEDLPAPQAVSLGGLHGHSNERLSRKRRRPDNRRKAENTVGQSGRWSRPRCWTLRRAKTSHANLKRGDDSNKNNSQRQI